MNCSSAVVPMDSSPVRSPQAVHTALSRRFVGRAVIEIGTRNGDGMSCFAQVARRAVAVEAEISYCKKLSLRAEALRSVQLAAFAVACGAFPNVKLPAGGSWDAVTWWQMHPHLRNSKVLEDLRQLALNRQLKLSQAAEAVVLFDTSWKVDRQSWKALRMQAAWFEHVEFDERQLCSHGSTVVKPQSPTLCEKRAKGSFIVAGIRILPRIDAHGHNRSVNDREQVGTAAWHQRPLNEGGAAGVYEPAADMNRHAICLTGSERSFVEIGQNVREGTLRSLGTAAVTLFGVRPPHEDWTTIRRLLPMYEGIHTLQQQQPCFTDAMLNLTKSWLHCNFHGRTGDCRASALQELCDLARCDAMIRAIEDARGLSFDTVTRLRADLFWEAHIQLPASPSDRTVYVPEPDSQGGANDHLAFGARAPMARYLNRLEHIMRAADVVVRRKLSNTESFLAFAMKHEGITVVRVREWAYCAHTRKALLDYYGIRGCIGRVRCRTRCQALTCSRGGQKSGNCDCLDAPCAAMFGNASNRAWTNWPKWYKNSGKEPYGCFGKSRRLSASMHCIDVAQTQLHHRCTLATAASTKRRAECNAPCAWPRDEHTGTPLSYSELSELPACILRRDDPAVLNPLEAPLLEGGRQCGHVSRRSHFWNHSGVIPAVWAPVGCPQLYNCSHSKGNDRD